MRVKFYSNFKERIIVKNNTNSNSLFNKYLIAFAISFVVFFNTIFAQFDISNTNQFYSFNTSFSNSNLPKKSAFSLVDNFNISKDSSIENGHFDETFNVPHDLPYFTSSCVEGTVNRFTGSFHSDLYIGDSSGTNILYAWGASMNTYAGTVNSSGNDTYIPSRVYSPFYNGIPYEVRSAYPNKNNVLGFRTSTKLYIFGDAAGISILTSYNGFGGGSINASASDVTSKLPSGVAITDIAKFEISTSAIAIVTKNGNVYMLTKAAYLAGDNTTNNKYSGTIATSTSASNVTSSTQFTISTKPSLTVGSSISIVNASKSSEIITGTINTYVQSTGVLTISINSQTGNTSTKSWNINTSPTYETNWHQVKLSDGTTPLSGVTKFSLSGSGAFALTDKGKIYYWGNTANVNGIANTYSSSTGYNYAYDMSSQVPSGVNVTDLLVMGSSTNSSVLYILCSDKNVYANGLNTNGCLGINLSSTAYTFNATTSSSIAPTSVISTTIFTIASGPSSLANGTVVTFTNKNNAAQYVTGTVNTTTIVSSKVATIKITPTSPITGATATTTWILTYGLVDNTSGNQATFSKVVDPAGSGYLSNIVKIDGNTHADYFTIGAMDASGNIYGWGDNQRDMLQQDKSIVYLNKPKQIFTTLNTVPTNYVNNPGSGYTDFAMAGHFIIAFFNSNSVSQYWYLGHNTNGSIGYDPAKVIQPPGVEFAPGESDGSSGTMLNIPVYLNTPSGITFNCSNTQPRITTTGTLNAFTTCANTASSTQSFSVSGVYLSTNITITAPTGFEVSTSPSSGFATSATLTPSGDIVSSTTIYVRLASANSSPSSDNITCESSPATTQNVAVSGTVNPLPTAYTVTGGGAYCSGGTGSAVGLNSSQTGVNYQLQLDAVNVGTVVAGTGSAISFGNKTSAGTYTVIATNATSSCAISMTGSVIVSITSLPTINDVTGTTTICNGSSTTLTATSGATSPVYNWYDALTNGNLLNTGNIYTPSPTSTTSYYVAVTANGCASSPRTTKIITVNPIPTISGITGNATCYGNTATLTASSSNSSPTYNWYDALTGGNLVGTGNPLTTANLIIGTNYYASVTSAGCNASARTLTAVTINPLPTASNAVGDSRTGAGTLNISASASAGATLDWFANITGGSALTSSSLSFTTPSISVTTPYYAQARNSTTGCIASSRLAVVATINGTFSAGSISAAQTICSGITPDAFSSITDASGGTGTISYQWESSTDNSNFTNASGSATSATYAPGALTQTTYYRRAAKTTTIADGTVYSNIITVTVNPIPTISGISGTATICSGNSTTLTASSSNGSPTFNWYDAATNGNLLYTGAAYTTSTLNSGVTYYASVTASGCTSTSRTSQAITVTALPTISSVSGTTTICNGSTTTLTASSSAGSPTYDWYIASSGGVSLLRSSSFTTPTLSSNTTYYVSVTASSCTSSDRTATNITVNPIPTIIGVTGTTGICAGTTTTITASSSASMPSYNWYDAATNGTLLYNGSTFTTPTLNSNNNYYVSVTSGGCTSASRTLSAITVSALPIASSPVNNNRIGSGPVIISATASSSATLDWYSVSTSGSVLSSGNGVTTYTTPSISTTTTYYAQARLNASPGCVSASRIPVVATIGPIGPGSIGSTQTICSSTTPTAFTSISDASSDNAITYQWKSSTDNSNFTNASGSATSATYAPGALTQTTYYKRDATSIDGTVSTNTITVSVNAAAAISSSPSASSQSLCINASPVDLSVTASGAGLTYQWYSNASHTNTGGTLIAGATTATYTPLTTAAGTTYYYVIVTGICGSAVTSS
ncbi:MAG: hypothetical protein WCG74_10940, partial [Sediminibacterium sp.]